MLLLIVLLAAGIIALTILAISAPMLSSKISAQQRETRGYDDWGDR